MTKPKSKLAKAIKRLKKFKLKDAPEDHSYLHLSKKDEKRVADWIKEHQKRCRYGYATGTIGDKYKFSILPTGIGDFISVECCCDKERLELTDFDSL